MIQLTLKQLAEITNGQCIGDENISFHGISIDSRHDQAGQLFVALIGENLNGHDYIAEVKNRGAVAAVVSQQLNSDIPVVVVDDTTRALGKLGQYWRGLFSIPLIALTGSNGKTTTKNMIQAILVEASQGESNQVLATKGNLNNHIGVPLMLSRLNQDQRIAVIEMGMNHFDEIHYLSQLASPTTALITNAGEGHLAGVGSIEGVAKAKGEIFSGLSAEGRAIINADDAFADYWKTLVKGKQIVTYGIDNSADVRGEITAGGFVLHYQDQAITISLQLLGKHNVMNALAASAATLSNGVSLKNIKVALEQLQPASGRMQTKAGRGGVTIIDDTYNANPLSLRAALTSITALPGKKILVLGDMRELGEQAKQLHFESGALAKTLGIDALFATGELTQQTVKSFGDNAQHFPDHASLIHALENCLQPNTTILVKGSRSMKMEQVVNALIT
jgi:UDP-N-acetylmuramoyl-tripeptide--D-alanyl-D-alanine ligase